MKRKKFISTFFRLFILTFLGVLITVITSRNKVSLNGDCSEGIQCKTCGKVSKCKLPEATTYKSNGKR